ncbi:MAG: hypothetical protein OEM62_12045, partial [Acidobacteriota bacterium]|nr:hypothetical protein [Acidobacteriota bacterium]
VDLDQTRGTYPRGTLFIPARGNTNTLEELLGDLAESAGVDVDRVESGFAASGVSLGSESMAPLRLPVIGLLRGEGIQPTSFGFLWHLLDQMLEVPFHQLDTRSLEKTDLTDFDVLVMPGGRGYDTALGDRAAERIGHWVDNGGVLIAIGEAVSWLSDNEMTTIEAWQPPPAEDLSVNQVAELTPARRDVSTPGAALATDLAPSHPLTVGLAIPPALLFQGKTILLPTGDPQRDLVVARREQPVVAGFSWPEVEERLRGALLVGVERRERGALVVFAQDPVFRLFWRGTAQPFLNALLYAASLHEYGLLFE